MATLPATLWKWNLAFTEIAGGLNRPTSLDLINNTAYIVTLAGKIWTIEDVACPPFF
jgi:hypothetical protein